MDDAIPRSKGPPTEWSAEQLATGIERVKENIERQSRAYANAMRKRQSQLEYMLYLYHVKLRADGLPHDARIVELGDRTYRSTSRRR